MRARAASVESARVRGSLLLGALWLAGCLSSTDERRDRPTPAPEASEDAAVPMPDATVADVLVDVAIADADAVRDAADTAPDASDAPVDTTPDVDAAANALADASDAADSEADAGPIDPPELLCDAGDEAWVKRAVQALLGRKPSGIEEVRVLVDLVAATSRQTVARGLMRMDGYEERWAAWLMDEVRVNRIGDKAHATCYGPPLRPDDQGDLASHIRDHGPLEPHPGVQYVMADVLRSALRLDDLSPFYRAHLFAMMSKPITGANVDALEMDLARRQDFGEVMSATYLNRGLVCTGCHNSEWSVTDHPDPAMDRFWALPGAFEKGIWGQSAGRPESEAYAVFRHLGVVKGSKGFRPWGMDPGCGTFTKGGYVKDDVADIDAFFIEPQGKTGSIWEVEQALHEGFDMLREDGLQVDPVSLAVDGREAFAALVSAHITNQAWRELLGYSLTLVHGFPRNAAQRDILLELANHFVAEGWSLRALLTDIVTHPLFNQAAPEDGCGDNPYLYPPVFDPWVIAEEDPQLAANSMGDALHRAPARVLLRMATVALAWPAPAAFPSQAEEELHKAVGVFVKDAEPGFAGVDFQGMLAWEARFGACGAVQAAPVVDDPDSSCVGRCGEEAPSGCYCNADCVGLGDCCADFEPVCAPAPLLFDFIAVLASAVETRVGAGSAPPTVREVAVALKDRLVTEPRIDSYEEPLVAALFGVSLDTPVTDVAGWEGRARLYCGALLQSPQFWLVGLAPEDQPDSPTLVVGSGYLEHCEALGPLVVTVDMGVVDCQDGALIVVPVEGTP